MCMCALCHERIPENVKPYTFPSTAPAALAALTPHLGGGGGGGGGGSSSSSSEAYYYYYYYYYSLSSGPNKEAKANANAKAKTKTKAFFCHTCWVWIYNLSICWTCGETVAREEERVGYGWCWWHWACVSCLICRNPIPPPPWTNDPRGIALHKMPMCRYCVKDLAFSKIEIVPDNLPAAAMMMPFLPEPPLPIPPLSPQPASLVSESSCRRPTPRWMDKLPSNRMSNNHSAPPRIPNKPLIPLIIEPSSAPPPSIHKQLVSPRDPKLASTPTPPPSSSSPSSTTTTTTTTTTTILLPPDSYNTTTSSSSPSSSPTNPTVVVAELRTPIRSSSIRKSYARAAALTRTDTRRRRRRRFNKSRSSPYVAKDLSALFSAVGGGEGGGRGVLV